MPGWPAGFELNFTNNLPDVVGRTDTTFSRSFANLRRERNGFGSRLMIVTASGLLDPAISDASYSLDTGALVIAVSKLPSQVENVGVDGSRGYI